jgi:hypothetical protein
MSLLICKIFKKIPKNIACDFGSLFGVGLICSGGVGVCLVGCISGMCVWFFRDVVCDEDPFSGGCRAFPMGLPKPNFNSNIAYKPQKWLPTD